MTGERRSALAIDGIALLVAAFVSYQFALSFGLNFGFDNQTTYLIGALRLLDPTVLTNDWLAAECTPYHPFFAYVGWALWSLDADGWGFAYGNVVALTLAGLAIYAAARSVAGRERGLAVFLVVLALAMHTRTHSVAVSYIVDFILQPSTFGALGWLGAAAFFLAGRWLASGLCLALGGLFHANYLLLSFPVFGLAQLLIEDRTRWRVVAWRLVLQLGPALLAFALLAPLVLAAAGDPQGAEARDIYFNVRSPHHYAPLHYTGRFVPVAAWQMLGIGAAWPLLQGRSGPGPRLGALLTGLAVLIWTGTFLTTYVVIPSVTQLFVWRAAPYSDLFAQIAFATALATWASDPARLRTQPPASLALALVGLVLLGLEGARDNHLTIPRILLQASGAALALAALGVVFEGLVRGTAPRGFRRWFSSPSPLTRWVPLLLAAGALGLWQQTTLGQRTQLERRSSLLRGLDRHEDELFAWVREHTAKEARFLIHPALERFRLHARRPIVADWKSPPILPGELLEWYARLGKIAGRPGFRSFGELAGGYDTLDRPRLEALRAEYDLSYAVVRPGAEQTLGFPVRYRNPRHVVLDLRPDAR